MVTLKNSGKIGSLPLKALLSTLLLLDFLYLTFSGLLLYFGKTGVVMGMARGALRSGHARAAFLMCALIILHFYLNRRIYFSEIKKLVKRR